MTALAALAPIGAVVLIALVLAGQALLDHFRSRPSVAEMVDQALDSGDSLDIARAAGVVAASDLDPLEQLYLAPAYGEHRLPGEAS